MEHTLQDLTSLVDVLTIDELQPFPLPKSIESLPSKNIEEFISNNELVGGYIKSLKGYYDKRTEILDKLQLISTVQDTVSKLIHDYVELSQKMVEHIKSIQQMYQEFINLEVIQYQLLSSNFNQEFLIKNKFSKLIAANHQESIEVLKKLKEIASETDFNNSLAQFRASRKSYHLRKEKLNRWNEERVSGFI